MREIGWKHQYDKETAYMWSFLERVFVKWRKVKMCNLFLQRGRTRPADREPPAVGDGRRAGARHRRRRPALTPPSALRSSSRPARG